MLGKPEVETAKQEQKCYHSEQEADILIGQSSLASVQNLYSSFSAYTPHLRTQL
jgi:hypothetical protein